PRRRTGIQRTVQEGDRLVAELTLVGGRPGLGAVASGHRNSAPYRDDQRRDVAPGTASSPIPATRGRARGHRGKLQFGTRCATVLSTMLTDGPLRPIPSRRYGTHHARWHEVILGTGRSPRLLVHVS